MTLEGCHFRFGDLIALSPRQEWHVNESVIGAQFDETEMWGFYSASFSLPGITKWVQMRSSKTTLLGTERGELNGFSIAVEAKTWPLWTLDGVTVEFFNQISTLDVDEELSALRSRVHIRARSATVLGNADFYKVATRPVQVLFALATGEFTTPVSGEGSIAPFDPKGGNVFCERRWHPHDIRFEVDKLRFGFTYSTLVALGQDACQKWLERSAKSEAVFNLYLATLRDGTGTMELRFLMIVQALETLHRRSNSDAVLESAAWDVLRPQLANIITERVSKGPKREALLSRVQFFNELSLKQRLLSLLKALGPHAQGIAGGNEEAFVRRVVKTRNEFTHWSSGEDKDVFKEEQLVFATHRLIALLEMVLILDVGFGLDSSPLQEVWRRRISWLTAG
ncbi:MAG: HEPN domain-containing protein [Pseudomonadota bacterium]